jgi:hypothetical protein
MTTLIAVGSVVLLVALFAAIAHFASGGSSGPAGVGDPAPQSVLQPLEHPNAALFDQVGSGGVPNPLHRVNGNSGNAGDFLKGSNGKPEFFYAGAEYCPFCAAERWSMIMALSRFGSFDGLKLTASSSTDNFPNTSTFTFVDAKYTSNTIDFSSVETQDRDQNALQTPTPQQTQILSKYSTDQYVGKGNGGGIPFISTANQYVQSGSGYSPGILDTYDWQQIADKVKNNPNDDVTKDIVGNANWITAAICKTTNQAPPTVCNSTAIQNLEKQL